MTVEHINSVKNLQEL